MLTTLKVSSLEYKCVFYRPEDNKKGGTPKELNFEGLEMQKWNIPTDRTQRKDEKIGVICLVIMFIMLVIYMRLKDIIYLFQKMLWIVDINPWVSLFFVDSAVIWYLYSLYLTNGNPKIN